MKNDQVAKLHARMQARMLARLALRWPQAHTYMPDGGNRVHCAQPLTGTERDLFDAYVLAYQDAIDDTLDLMGLREDPVEQAIALRMAENNIFQGGGARHTPTQRAEISVRARSTSSSKQARARAEALFKNGNGHK